MTLIYPLFLCTSSELPKLSYLETLLFDWLSLAHQLSICLSLYDFLSPIIRGVLDFQHPIINQISHLLTLQKPSALTNQYDYIYRYIHTHTHTNKLVSYLCICPCHFFTQSKEAIDKFGTKIHETSISDTGNHRSFEVNRDFTKKNSLVQKIGNK